MEKKKEVKELEAIKTENDVEPVVEIIPAELPVTTPEEVPVPQLEEVVRDEKPWTPKTSLGRQVAEGKIKNIDEILFAGKKIMEPMIVDRLVPALQSELILIGGRGGKGGGAMRIPIRITAKMHSSGRRFRTSALLAVGDGNGLIGVGRAGSIEPRNSMEKALNKSKLSVIKIKRGCGDWECGCGTEHSILFKTKGKSGSVKVELLPAPKGVGLVAGNEAKKILRLAGIKDMWVKTYGNTSNRINLAYAVFDALKKLYIYEK